MPVRCNTIPPFRDIRLEYSEVSKYPTLSQNPNLSKEKTGNIRAPNNIKRNKKPLLQEEK
jgi:hypothetical protein